MPALPDPPLADGVVLIRAWHEEDVPAITAACQDPEIPRWTRVPSPYTESDAREWLASVEEAHRDGTAVELAITDASSGQVLGAIGLHGVDHDQQRAEVGYWVAREARGRGVASRAVRLLSRWGLTQPGLHRVALLTDVRNVASQRVAEAAGFVPEGVLRSYMRVNDERSDFVVYSLIRTDV